MNDCCNDAHIIRFVIKYVDWFSRGGIECAVDMMSGVWAMQKYMEYIGRVYASKSASTFYVGGFMAGTGHDINRCRDVHRTVANAAHICIKG